MARLTPFSTIIHIDPLRRRLREGTKDTQRELLREAYGQARLVIRERFEAHGQPAETLAQSARLMDGMLELIVETVGHRLGMMPPVSVVAVGGYGREELFPDSDIDILFLCGEEAGRSEMFVQEVLYSLWDLGLTVGQSVRTVAETLAIAATDISLRTSLLDSRLVCGDEALFTALQAAFTDYRRDSNIADFIEAKLAERKARHLRGNDSRYVLEPNIKEGKGGLRDLQTLFWLAQYVLSARKLDDLVRLQLLTHDEFRAYAKARDFLWRVRIHLHFIAGRAEEHLTFDMQRAIAEKMGFYDDGTARGVERFMKQYFLVARTVGNLTRSVCAVLEETRMRKPRVGTSRRMQVERALGDFQLDGERIAVKAANAFAKKPLLLITLFQTAQAHSLHIHPQTLQAVTRSLAFVDGRLRRDPDANAAFMDILLSKHNPEPTLRRMSEAGVLGRFIPDFGKVIGQMQFDMYHVFTVDEHTINAIGILHGIGMEKYKDDMPVASEVIHLIKSRRVLFLSLFAHDIAKGRGGDHSMLGEVVVRKLARRFSFTAQETENCAWLVRHHLLMSRTAFKRDINDPKTIEDFVSKVQSPERLRLLLVLTVADIRAVGPNVWNGWKGALIRDLYYRAESHMGAGAQNAVKSNVTADIRTGLRQKLPEWSEAEIDGYLAECDASLQGIHDAGTHARIARLLRESIATGRPLAMDTQSDDFRAITDLMLCLPDQQGVFSRVAGALALAGANILSAKIFTFKNGMALEMFHIQDGQNRAFDRPDRLARLSVLLNQAVAGELDLAREIARTRLSYPSRMDAFKVPPRVFIENRLSAHHTVIEVGGRDRIGFLYSVTNVLAERGLSIATAHISTYGERAVDVFYVKDAFGMKLHHHDTIKRLHDALVACLSGTGTETGKLAV